MLVMKPNRHTKAYFERKKQRASSKADHYSLFQARHGTSHFNKSDISPALASRKESVMLIRLAQPGAYADLGDVWLRAQLARLTQRHLQFGGHYRIDADALLARLARTARAAKAAAAPVAAKTLTGDSIRRATIEAIEHCSRLEGAPPMLPQSPSRTERLHDSAMHAIPRVFLPIHRLGTPPRDEWMAVLPENTEIVVADVKGKPSSIGIEKAISIVQSRAYLEARARQLLVPLGKENGEWRLIAIDFGIEAQHNDCEFLMCFAFQATKSDPAATRPYVEVGFALPVRSSIGPMFILTIQTTTGLAG